MKRKYPVWMPSDEEIKEFDNTTSNIRILTDVLPYYREMFSRVAERAIEANEVEKAITREELYKILSDFKWSINHPDASESCPCPELWHQLRMILSKTCEPHDFFTAADLFKSAEWNVQRVKDLESEIADHNRKLVQVQIDILCSVDNNYDAVSKKLNDLKSQLDSLGTNK